MKKVFNRFTALFLAIVLSISVLPCTGMAETLSDVTGATADESAVTENTSG